MLVLIDESAGIMQNITDTLAHINPPTKMTLAAGYVLAVPALFVIAPALRNPAGRAPVVGLPNRAIIAAELLGAGLRHHRFVRRGPAGRQRSERPLGNRLHDDLAPLRKQTPPPEVH